MQVVTVPYGAYLIVRVDGPLTTDRAPGLLAAARSARRESPLGVIYDVSGARLDESAPDILVRLADEALVWPGTPAAVLSDLEASRALLTAGAGDRLPIAHTVDGAVEQLRADTNWRRAAISLPPSLDVPRRARRFVEDRISRWRLPALIDNATLIAGELVTNAVVHAGTYLDVQLCTHRQFLSIAVTDRSGSPVRPGRPPPDAETGRGLLLVQALAHRWGQISAPSGDAAPTAGKTVWAVLATAGGGPA